jgi:2-polyprenyl-3-methyl-5-hydroxy-6-metoxy-1,4-benzoquinol methylase
MQRPVYLAAAKLLKGRQRRRVLDVGCGYPIKLNDVIVPLAERVVALDQPSVVERFGRSFPRIAFAAADLERPSIQGKFDLIICSDVVEHLIDPQPCVDFIRDSLSPDGYAVISTPERDLLRGADATASPKREHVREWNQEELANWLKSSGFIVIDHRVVHGAAFSLRQWLRGRWRRTCQVVVLRR